ncbi:MAG: hypothetical protein RLZ56_1440 [Bacteroidota bacterium]
MQNIIDIFNLLILLPIFIWIIKCRSIQIKYNHFAIYLILGLINELIHIGKYNNSTINLASSIYYLIETQFLLNIFLFWLGESFIRKITLHTIYFLLWFFDFINWYVEKNINVPWMYFLMLIGLIILGIKIISKNNITNARSQKLIIIPFIVYAIYFIIINILMAFLYTKQNQQLFINLYSVINLINFLSYISYSLALLWAPKKEQFL